ncbi:MAG: glutamate-1-semialdehyde 2,1-aminomutase [Polyangiaceae bacterium]|nr:glutamate-1-semialdehyde 2,1-aminomutase [Myxococcales bacterium]MCB9589333.1 glutamate-1-semialdehyde 2,1-aminomutase [Polyangiaceae bacterium]
MTSSEQLFKDSAARMPGGVNSPVRAFRAVGGHPIFVASAKGSKITSADGREYVDYIGSWGPALLGHAHAPTIQAVQEAAERGLSYGAPTELELRFAERVMELYPSIQMMRCVSSGTEATMSALRVARGFTGRDVIVKFNGAYHGHADCLLVQAGSGAATFGNPDSAGVPKAMVQNTLSMPYNDLSALEALFDNRASEIAAVIVEPVAGNMGCVPPEPGFLEGLVSLCTDAGAVSIFDEVMTGCRLAPGGAQERYKLKPDMTCLGKVVGGGMPLAVYGGRREIMECVAPLGAVYQAGTLSGNPLAVSAGLATLNALTPDVYKQLEASSARLEAGLKQALSDTNIKATVQRVGAMLTLFFHDGRVTSWDQASQCDKERFSAWHQRMLAAGVLWPPSQFEAAFISAAHDASDIDRTIEAARQALKAL